MGQRGPPGPLQADYRVTKDQRVFWRSSKIPSLETSAAARRSIRSEREPRGRILKPFRIPDASPQAKTVKSEVARK